MKSFALWVVVAGLFIHARIAPAATTNVFFTEFEANQYTTASDLIGQAGWLGEGSGGNGILANGITGQGQSAYIGFEPPDPGDDLFVWRPINFNPIAAGYPLVKFSVLINIIDSETTTNRDDFRWSVYNTQGDRLFSIGFDNLFLDVGFQLDGTNQLTLPPSLYFVNDSNYTLNVSMNFAANRWSATYNNVLIATNQLITTTNAPLNLGDVDAVWLVNQINGTNTPGDNFMMFDNYSITAETLPAPPAQVQFIGRTGDGQTILRVFSDNGSRWALEATTNFVNWIAVKTNLVSGTYFDQVDTTAGGFQRRFYRARFVP